MAIVLDDLSISAGVTF
uniref:Uncharacterized protein n=1 Tax=Anguilla anguilla TaxID=7936 RepID=A0A0E9SA51_ANGAN